jgi:hypothetical protein
MMTSESRSADPVKAVFAPVHKRAFGIAIGVAAALLIFGVTALDLLFRPSPHIPLELLSQYFAGYDISWRGALIGAAWAGFVGFVAGWFFAFCRNLILTIVLFVVRSKAELAQTRDFLDHI